MYMAAAAIPELTAAVAGGLAVGYRPTSQMTVLGWLPGFSSGLYIAGAGRLNNLLGQLGKEWGWNRSWYRIFLTGSEKVFLFWPKVPLHGYLRSCKGDFKFMCI
jgi:hypothetical protein